MVLKGFIIELILGGKKEKDLGIEKLSKGKIGGVRASSYIFATSTFKLARRWRMIVTIHPLLACRTCGAGMIADPGENRN
jgi:hypothetical protein